VSSLSPPVQPLSMPSIGAFKSHTCPFLDLGTYGPKSSYGSALAPLSRTEAGVLAALSMNKMSMREKSRVSRPPPKMPRKHRPSANIVAGSAERCRESTITALPKILAAIWPRRMPALPPPAIAIVGRWRSLHETIKRCRPSQTAARHRCRSIFRRPGNSTGGLVPATETTCWVDSLAGS